MFVESKIRVVKPLATVQVRRGVGNVYSLQGGPSWLVKVRKLEENNAKIPGEKEKKDLMAERGVFSTPVRSNTVFLLLKVYCVVYARVRVKTLQAVAISSSRRGGVRSWRRLTQSQLYRLLNIVKHKLIVVEESYRFVGDTAYRC